MDYAAIGKFLVDQVKRQPIGAKASFWSLACNLPLAPSIEESLRIAMQDWDGEVVEIYESITDREGMCALKLRKGKPVLLGELPDVLFVTYTDDDHRFRWRVIEVTSGCAATNPKPSENEAIEALMAHIRKSRGPERVRSTIASAREWRVTRYANRSAA